MNKSISIGVRLTVEVNGEVAEGFIEPGSRTMEKMFTAIESGLDPIETINYLSDRGCDYLEGENIENEILLVNALAILGPGAQNLFPAIEEEHPCYCGCEACGGCG